MERSWTIACAAADDTNLTKNHFGEAAHYAVYTLEEGGYCHVVDVPNPTPSEVHSHGGAQKASNIAGALEAHGVQVIVGMAFGPNIARMATRFVPVISKDIAPIEEAVAALSEERAEIAAKYDEGPGRRAILLRR